MKPAFLFAFLLLAPVAAFSQNAKIDSLKRVIETTKVDTVRGRTLCRLCTAYTQAEMTQQAEQCGRQGLSQLQQVNDRAGQAACHQNLAKLYVLQTNYPQALANLQRSHVLYQQVDANVSHIEVLESMGQLYMHLSRYDSSETAFREALALSEELGLPQLQAKNWNNLGNLHFTRNNFPKALDCFLRSLRLFERLRMTEDQASALSHIGNIFTMQGDYQRSIQYQLRGLRLLEHSTDLKLRASLLGNIGALYLSQNQFDEALVYLNRDLELRLKIGDSFGEAGTRHNLAYVYEIKGDYDRAMAESRAALAVRVKDGNRVGEAASLAGIAGILLKTGDLRQARAEATQALDLARSIGYPDVALYSTEILYKIDSSTANWKAAFFHLLANKQTADSLKNDEKSREIGRLEAEYAAEKEREILEARQQAELLKRNWMLGSAAGGLLLLLLVAFTLFRSRQKEKKNNAALRLLNEQINQQKSEIEAQNSEITAQRDQLNDSNQRLIALDRMKDELSGMIVHDLKNPLNAVLAMAALPPEPKRLQVIRSAGQQMSQLILNLLDVQKYEEAALVLKTETVAAAQLLHRAAEQTEFLAEQKQIRFQIEADPRLAAEADAELIVRVLVNLLTNAIKYAPAGDVIEIQAIYDPERGAVFRVTDHGKGIPPDQLDRIFDKFSQVDGGQASGKLRSTGLGLTFCRLTVKAHGGSIGVRSEVGRYTTFEFNLPKASIAEQAFVTWTSKEAPVIGPLSAELLSQHAQLLAELRAVPIYSVSDLLDLLERLPDQPVELAAWKAAVESAALSANEARFRELLG